MEKAAFVILGVMIVVLSSILPTIEAHRVAWAQVEATATTSVEPRDLWAQDDIVQNDRMKDFQEARRAYQYAQQVAHR